MSLKIIRKIDGNSRLILIFAGWGTDEALYKNVNRNNYDVAIVMLPVEPTFEDDRKNVISLIECYETVVVYCWSLGVIYAYELLEPIASSSHIAAIYAINGTLAPCNDAYGIPVAIYRGTHDSLSDENLKKFRRRMFATKREYNETEPLLPSDPDINALQKQLKYIEPLSGLDSSLPWRKAFISANDRIFPSDAQINAWQDIPIAILPESGHYISIQEIVDHTIPDTHAVTQSFTKSAVSYPNAANPQRRIAASLAAMLEKNDPAIGGAVLEIGHASELFTRMYMPLLKPSRATFVDLCTTPLPGLAEHEEVHCADAEQWISNQPGETYDYILSSSTLQWFTNHRRFLEQCHRVLKKRGMLICSSYVQGNLCELDAVRLSPIAYLSPDMLKSMVSNLFDIEEWWIENTREEFDTHRSLLRHIIATGVSPVSPSPHGVTNTDKDVKSLTYRAACFIAVKGVRSLR